MFRLPLFYYRVQMFFIRFDLPGKEKPYIVKKVQEKSKIKHGG